MARRPAALIPRLGALITAVLTATIATAEVPQGCYARSYDAAHMAQNPNQIVETILLHVYDDDQFEGHFANMFVTFANQGRLKGSRYAGQTLGQSLICWAEGGRAGCSVDCDGGSFRVTRDTGATLTIETQYLLVGPTEECGGAVDMAEKIGQPVRYRLNRVSPSLCGMRP